MSVTDLRDVLDEDEEVRDDVHVNIYFAWDKICTADNAENIHKLVKVIARELKRRS